MKKVLFTMLVLLIGSMSVQAQGNKAEQIKKIRQAYAEAKKDVDENGKNGNPRMDMQISLNDGTEVDEDFIINEDQTLNFYFRRIHLSGDTDLFDARCYLITTNSSANGHTSYRELLFNPFTGHLLFCFLRSETHAGFVMESRYYYDEQGNLIEEKHKAGGEEQSADSPYGGGGSNILELAKRYTSLFDDIMRHKSVNADSYEAQATANKAEQMKTIRSLYAQAKQKIADDAKSAIPRNMNIEIHDHEDPGMPPQNDVLNFWFEPVEDDNGISNSCYFLSSHCELGDHDVYSEWLFEPKTRQLLFCYSKQAQNEGPALEWRYYFASNGQCIEVKGEDSKYGPGFADKSQAKFYLSVFQAITSM